eukprot:TRINITY_DN1710_c2_g2_i3.p1 TRINITY_DN1710_c2_g2~~TRINITY_DN1710_c2_g2_i3.p1  ORF type:complete len:2520 (+),score=613.45 TRINITY_DN1710_c2_g2_i3:964-8523(+)
MYYETLLVHDKWYIRRFAAESFALIVRKVPVRKFPALLNTMLTRAENLPENVDTDTFCHGVSELLCEVMKGVQKHLYSRTHSYVPVMLSALSSANDSSPRFAIVFRAFRLIGRHVMGQHATDVWTSFEKALQQGFAPYRNSSGSTSGSKSASGAGAGANSATHLGLVLLIVTDWMTLYHGRKVDKPERVLGFATDIVPRQLLTTDITKLPHHALFKFLAAIYNYKGINTRSICTDHIKHLSKQQLTDPTAINSVLTLLVDCCQLPYFKEYILPLFWQTCDMYIQEHTDLVVRTITALVDQVPGVKVPAFGKSGGRDQKLSPTLEHILSLVSSSAPADIPLSAMVALPRCHLDSPKVLPKVIKVLGKVIKKLASQVKKVTLEDPVVNRYAAAILALPPSADSPLLETALTLIEVLSDERRRSSPSLLSALAYLTTSIKSHPELWKEYSGSEVVVSLPETLLLNLSAPNRQVRKDTLAILTALPPIPLDTSAVTKQEQGLLKSLKDISFFALCHEMVSMDLDISSERARSMLLRKMGLLASNKRLAPIHMRSLVHVAIGVFCNKLSILWPAAIEAIQAVAQADFELFWSEYWPLHSQIIDHAKIYSNLERGHIAHKTETKFLRRAGHAVDVQVEIPVLQPQGTASDVAIVEVFESSISPDPASATDAHTLHSLAWDTLSGIPALAQRRARDIIPLFFSFLDKEFFPLKTIQHESLPVEQDEEGSTKSTHKAARQKLMSYLHLFSKFKNPKSLARTHDLHQVLENLLTNTSSAVQSLALKCLKTWNHKYITPYLDNLEKLIGDDTFRDAIVNFPISVDAGMIENEHRADLLPIIIRIVYAKLLQRKGRKGSLSVQRASLLSYLSSVPAEELEFFFDLMTDAYQDNGLTGVKGLASVPLIMQLGYINMLEDVIRHISSKMMPYLKRTIPVILSEFQFAVQQGEKAADDDEKTGDRATLRTIRLHSIRRLCEILYKFPEYDYEDLIPRALKLFQPFIVKLPIENTQSRHGVLEVLVALASHSKLTQWLEGEEILPYVLKMLTAPSVSTDVQGGVMDIVEGLLQHAPHILRPHLPLLLQQLRKLILDRSSDGEPISSRIMGTNLSIRILDVLSRISKDVKSKKQGQELFDLLLPFLKKATTIRKESTKCDLLITLKNLMRHQNLPLTCVSFLARQFSVIKGLRARLTLASVFGEIASLMPEYAVTATVCEGLNALTSGVDEEYDYDKRLATFAEFNDKLYKKCTPALTYPIFYNLLHFAHDEDLSIRSSAAHGILQICRHIAKQPRDDPDTGGSYRNMLERAILPAIKARASARSESVRHEFIRILGELCRLFPEVLTDLQVLVNEDPEVDFFVNIIHIQTHRRVRALTRFASMVEGDSFLMPSLIKIFIPLLSRMAAESKEKDHNVVDAAVKGIGMCATKLEWRPYLGLVLKQVKLVLSADERVALRILCTTLEAFHFDLRSELANRDALPEPRSVAAAKARTAEAKQGKTSSADDAGVGEDDDDDDEGEEEEEEEDTTKEDELMDRKRRFEKMEDSLINLCLRPLQSFIAGKHASKTARIPIIAAIAGVLSKLSVLALEAELPKIFLVLSNHLRSREQHVRDSARETLIQVIKTVGEQYFGVGLSILHRQLAKGYQVHVLVYTLNYVLRDLSSYAKPGFLDTSINECCEILLEEVFGTVAEEKNVDALANKMKETKARKALDSFSLLASLVTFRPYVRALIQPLQDGIVVRANSLKDIRKYKEVFSRIIQGLADNPSVDPADFLLYTHYLVQSSIPEKKKATPTPEKKPERKKPRIIVPSQFLVGDVMLRNASAVNASKIRAAGSVDMHVLGEFGLDLFYRFLKQSRFDTKNQAHMEMLDPFVGVMLRCLRSKWNQTVTVALRALGILLRCPLPSIRPAVPEIGNRIFSLSKMAGSLGEELVVSCWKVLTVILRECPYYEVDQDQLVHYLTVLSIDLETPAKHNTAFALIRGILSRKLVLPQVYDLITRIAALLVRSQSKPIRDLCAQVFYEFLLNYPLGDRRVQSHFNFVMSNLDYQYESGRLSVLGLIHSIIVKFPEELVNARATFFFVPLVTRLVNDQSKACTELVAACLRGLFKRVEQAKREELFTFAVKWLNQDQELLQRAALQVAGLAVDLDPTYLGSQRGDVLAFIRQHIDSAPSDGMWEFEDDADEPASWSIAYYSLLLLEKLQGHDIRLDTLVPNVWSSLVPYLLYPVSWVRLVASRLYGAYFARFDASNVQSLQSSVKAMYSTPKPSGKKSKTPKRKSLARDAPCPLSKKELRHQILNSLTNQLYSAQLDEQLANQCIKNMLFLLSWEVFLGEKPSSDDGASGEENASDSEGEEDMTPEASRKIPDNMERWLMHRLAYFARSGLQRRIAVFKFFAACAARFGAEFVARYLDKITSPLYRVLNNTATEEVQELHALAEEVGNMLQGVVGTSEYFKSYNNVRTRITQKRQERKRARAMEAVIDPEKAAQRKKRKHEKNKATRKRKIEALRSRRAKVRVKRGNEPIMLNDEANDSL